MRRTLKNMFGTETGLHYKDGSPILVGDRIKVEGLGQIATVHVRMNKAKIYFYLTYYANNRGYTRPLSQIMLCDFKKDTTPTWANGRPKVTRPKFIPPQYGTDKELIRRRATHADKNGDYILCLEDYDTAIYGTIR